MLKCRKIDDIININKKYDFLHLTKLKNINSMIVTFF